MQINLSIIIPVYKVEAVLERCVNSILHADIPIDTYEIILVDDGSPDNSGKVADDLSLKYPGLITVFHQKNQGQSVARNLGISHARGRYIWFIDSDDYIEGDAINEIISKAIEKNLDACTFHSRIVDTNGKYLDTGGRQPFPSDEIIDGESAIIRGMEISGPCGALYSRKLIMDNNIRFFPGITHQDVDFNTRFYAFAKRIMFTDKLIYVYEISETSTTNTKTFERFVKLQKDSATVCKLTLEFAESGLVSHKLSSFLKKRANSTALGLILYLRKQDKKDVLDIILSTLREYGIFPFKGKAISWKSTLAMQFLNIIYVAKNIVKRK